MANAFGSKTAAVNLTVANRVWFIDSASAAAGADSRSASSCIRFFRPQRYHLSILKEKQPDKIAGRYQTPSSRSTQIGRAHV